MHSLPDKPFQSPSHVGLEKSSFRFIEKVLLELHPSLNKKLLC